MRRAICIASTLVLASMIVTPARADTGVVWEGLRCHETVAVFPAPAVARDATLVLLAYQCEQMRAGGIGFGEVAVTEISVTEPCLECPGGTRSKLLRQASDNGILVHGLRDLGVRATSVAKIDYQAKAMETHVNVRIPHARHSMAATGGAPAEPAPRAEEDRGAAGVRYTYDGEEGTVVISYTNYSQTAREAVIELDADGDPQLARWLGSAKATTVGLVTRGHWTATAALEGR